MMPSSKVATTLAGAGSSSDGSCITLTTRPAHVGKTLPLSHKLGPSGQSLKRYNGGKSLANRTGQAMYGLTAKLASDLLQQSVATK